MTLLGYLLDGRTAEALSTMVRPLEPLASSGVWSEAHCMSMLWGFVIGEEESAESVATMLEGSWVSGFAGSSMLLVNFHIIGSSSHGRHVFWRSLWTISCYPVVYRGFLICNGRCSYLLNDLP